MTEIIFFNSMFTYDSELKFVNNKKGLFKLIKISSLTTENISFKTNNRTMLSGGTPSSSKC